MHITQTSASIPTNILHNHKDHQMLFVGRPNVHTNSKMADGRHIEKNISRHISAVV